MEIRAYWRILKRRWLVVLVPALIVLVLGLITYNPPPDSYNAGVRFIAGQEPAPMSGESDEERLANWQTSEYIVNTLATWVRSGQFAELVSQRLEQRGFDVQPQSIVNGIAADDARSVMTLSLTYGDPEVLTELLNEAAAVLISENSRGLPQLGGQTAELVQLDEPIVNKVQPSILNQLDLPFRISLALVVGVGLALLVEYIDPTLYEGKELETMGFSVLGVIPSTGKRTSRQK